MMYEHNQQQHVAGAMHPGFYTIYRPAVIRHCLTYVANIR